MGNPIVKGRYRTADNPIFEIFRLEGAHAAIAGFSGNPPKEFSLQKQNTSSERGEIPHRRDSPRAKRLIR